MFQKWSLKEDSDTVNDRVIMDDDKSDVTPCDEDENDDRNIEDADVTIVDATSRGTKPGNILRVKSDADIRENNNDTEESSHNNLNKNQVLASLPKQSWLLRWEWIMNL